MNVKELIEQLQKLPSEAKVYMIWDGEPRNPVEIAYLSKSGHAMVVGSTEIVYQDKFTPIGTTEDGDRFWSTPDVKCNPEDEIIF